MKAILAFLVPFEKLLEQRVDRKGGMNLLPAIKTWEWETTGERKWLYWNSLQKGYTSHP
jgi:hypothetical protein